MKLNIKIMNFNKFIKESIKEKFLDKILDKISKNVTISTIEQNFLDSYSNMNEDDLIDFKMLSKETTFDKISTLLELKKNEYSLEADGEYYEPLLIKNEN